MGVHKELYDWALEQEKAGASAEDIVTALPHSKVDSKTAEWAKNALSAGYPADEIFKQFKAAEVLAAAPSVGERIGSAYDWMKQKISGPAEVPGPVSVDTVPAHAATLPVSAIAPVNAFQGLKGSPVAPGMPVEPLRGSTAAAGLMEAGKIPVDVAKGAGAAGAYVGKGLTGIAEAVTDVTGDPGGVVKTAKDFWNAEIKAVTPEKPSTAWQAGQSVIANVPGLAASMVTGNPSLSLSWMGATSFGDRYGTLRSAGFSPARATALSVPHALAEAIGEKGSLDVLMKPAMSYGKRALTSMALDILGENATTAMQDALQKVSDRPDMTVAEFLSDLWNTTRVSAVAGPMTAGVAQMGHALAERDAKQFTAAPVQAPVAAASGVPASAPVMPSKMPEMGIPVKQAVTMPPTEAAASPGLEQAGASASPSVPARKVSPLIYIDKHREIMSKRTADMTPDEHAYALTHDEITGLPNMRAFKDAPEQSHMVLLDVDGFKSVNDQFGHDAGDRYLRAIREAAEMNGINWLHRLHGDEHAFYAASEEQAQERQRQLDNAFKNVRIEVTDTRTGAQAILQGVGYSSGIGTGGNFHDRFQAADADLYRSKDFRTEFTGQRVPGNLPAEVSVRTREEGDRPEAQPGEGVLRGQRDQVALPPDSTLLSEAGMMMSGRTRYDNHAQFMSYRPAGWTFDRAGDFLSAVARGEAAPSTSAQKRFVDKALSGMKELKEQEARYNELPPVEGEPNKGVQNEKEVQREEAEEVAPATEPVTLVKRDMPGKTIPSPVILSNDNKTASGIKAAYNTIQKKMGKAKQEGLDLGLKGSDLRAPERENQPVSMDDLPLGKATNEAADREKQESIPLEEKQPWQMTRDEWHDAKDAKRGNGAYSTLRGGAAHQARAENLDSFNYGVKPRFDEELKDYIQPDHKDVVQKALSEGKSVPDEVLKQYPDLAPTELHSIGSAIFKKGTKAFRAWASRSLVKSFDAIGQRINPEIKEEVLDAAFGVPNFIVERHPARKPLYLENLQRAENRNRDNTFVFKPDQEVNYPGVEPILGLGKADAQTLSDALVRGDREKVRYTPEQLKDKFKASDDVVSAYDAARQMIERLQGLIISKTKDIALAPYETVPQLHDKLSRIANDLIEMTDEKEREKYMEQMVHDAAASQFDVDAQKAMKRISTYMEQIHEYISIFDENPGYIPRVREDGAFKVTVSRRTEPGAEFPYEEVFMQTEKTEAEAKALKASVMKDPKKYFPENFNEASKYRYDVVRNKKLSEDIYQDIGSMAAREELLRQAITKAEQRGEVKVADVEAISDAIMSAVQEEVAKRGAGRAFIGRHKTLIEGYKTEDMNKVLVSHITGMVGWLNKGLYGVRGLREIGAITDTNDMRWAQQYFKNSLRNSNALDNTIAHARGVASMWYLGMNLKSALLNSFQHYMTAIPEFSRFTGSSSVQLEKARGAVMTGQLSEFDKRVLNDAVESGHADAQYTRSISGAADRAPERGFSRVVDISMMPFQYVESTMNRKPAYLAAMRLFTGAKNAKGKYYGLNKNGKPYDLSYEEAMKKADEFVRAAHFQISRENEPEFVQKMGPVGHGLYTFQSFTANYFNWLFNRASQGEVGVLGRSALALWAFGGLMAAPFSDEFDSIFMKLFGFSVKHQLRKMIRGALQSVGYERGPATTLEDVIMTGIPSAMGVNMSRSVQVNTPMPIALFIDPEKTASEKLSGALGGLAEKAGRSVSAAARGDWHRAAEHASPSAISNALAAYRLYNEGATTMHGKPIVDESGRKQLKASGAEAARKALGFQDTRISKVQEYRKYEGDLKERWNGKRQDLLDKYRMSKGDREKRDAVGREIDEFNRKLKSDDEARIIISPITAKSKIDAILNRPGKTKIREGRFMREMEQ